MQIVDKEEFNENSRYYGYSKLTKTKIFKEVRNVVELYSMNVISSMIQLSTIIWI
ncbi:hypothetical protein [Mycoplasmopsis cynos]|uniref:hypothetical protein n=1 Tax=Mycoplasmopsis cynos TaxID=171284 RepID=UPI00220F5561|nr:hypothetical protein [Mycoplasmopsis cynos]UWV81228.1 hypothetical protein NW065_04620 [Mycoplasmopsis cynos]